MIQIKRTGEVLALEVPLESFDENDDAFVWDHAEFPHPLLTIDYNKSGEVIGISVVGSLADHLEVTIREWIKSVSQE
jgi:hypothetical protein